MTRDVKSSTGIRSSPIDTCPRALYPSVRTVPVWTVADASEAEIKSYGVAAVAPLAITNPSRSSGGTGDTSVPGRGTKAITRANLQIELTQYDAKALPEWAAEFSEFFFQTDEQHPDVKTNCTLIKKSCRRKFLQQQVKTDIRKISDCSNFLKRLEQMHPV